MKMYKCEDCGHLFEEGEERRYTESRGEYFGAPAEESYVGCPLCGGSYEPIKPCKLCETYEHDSDDEYCEDCRIDVKKRFVTLIKGNFLADEIELLKEVYEGELVI